MPPPYKMERVMGIEPTLSAWEADALPLSYTRIVTLIISDDSGFVNAYYVEQPNSAARTMQVVRSGKSLSVIFKNPLQSVF